MKQITLSIEQMKHLEELGLDTSDASMVWTLDENGIDLIISQKVWLKMFTYIPAYTLQDILEKLPKYIIAATKQIKTVKFDLALIYEEYQCPKVMYMWGSPQRQWLKCTHADTMLEAAYNMLLWCIENNYIKTNKV